MSIQLSPGVNISEIDLTTVVPSVSSTTGAFAGRFVWVDVARLATCFIRNFRTFYCFSKVCFCLEKNGIIFFYLSERSVCCCIYLKAAIASSLF